MGTEEADSHGSFGLCFIRVQEGQGNFQTLLRLMCQLHIGKTRVDRKAPPFTLLSFCRSCNKSEQDYVNYEHLD